MTSPRHRASTHRHHCYAALCALASVLLLALVAGASPAAAQCAPNDLGCEDITVRAPTTTNWGRPSFPPASFNPEPVYRPTAAERATSREKARKALAEAAKKAREKAAQKREAEQQAREKALKACLVNAETRMMWCQYRGNLLCSVVGGKLGNKLGGPAGGGAYGTCYVLYDQDCRRGLRVDNAVCQRTKKCLDDGRDVSQCGSFWYRMGRGGDFFDPWPHTTAPNRMRCTSTHTKWCR